MAQNSQFSSVSRLFIVAASIAIVVIAMQASASILNMVLMALFITILATPFLDWLQRRGLPGGVAVLVAILVVLGLSLAVVGLIGLSISRFPEKLPVYEARLDEISANLNGVLTGWGFEASELMAVDTFSPNALLRFIAGTLAQIGGLLGSALVILMVVAFMLLEVSGFGDKLQHVMGKTNNDTLERLVSFNHNIRKYIVARAWLGLASAIMDTLVLLFVGVDFALMWGVLAFFFGFIPSIGYWLSLIPPVLLALIQLGWQEALLVFLGYTIFNSIIDNIIGPKYMGDGANLAPVLVFLSLIFWAWILGPIGALLGVPLTLMVKQLILEGSAETRWLAELMSARISDKSASPTASKDTPVATG
jgi:predicted PurR-regulated permease PerM